MNCTNCICPSRLFNIHVCAKHQHVTWMHLQLVAACRTSTINLHFHVIRAITDILWWLMQIILKRIQCWNAFWNSKAYMALSVPLCHALHLHSYHISMISYPFIATGRCINSSSRNDTEKQSMSLELRMRFFNVHKCMRYDRKTQWFT